MNNTFNPQRFGWYFKKHTIDHGRTYLLSLAVAAGVVFLGLALPAYIGTGYVSESYQFGMYIFLVWLGGSIFTSTIFADLGDRKKAILPLTLPVSHMEKFVVAWLYTFPIFLIVANCVFFGVDSIVLSMSHSSLTFVPKNKILNLLNPQTPGTMALAVFILFQIMNFWGAIYFNRLHFIKTAFAFFITFLASNILSTGILLLISRGDLSSISFFFQDEVMIKGKPRVLFISNSIQITGWVIFALMLIILWVSTYFKLKEKQV